MKYPKPVMTAPELRKMGFPRVVLEEAYKTPGQKFAWRTNPAKKSSMRVFDTAGFERWRLEQMRLEQLG